MRVTRAWAVLIKRLGYDRWVAQCGDWGAGVTLTLARLCLGAGDAGASFACRLARRAIGHGAAATFGYAARTILAPRLPQFLLDHTEVSVEVIVEDRLIDLVPGGFDAGIRLNEAVERDMVTVPVGPDRRTVVVGTPAYFSHHARPETPSDLDHHICVN